jgi:MFS family permease
LRRLGLLGFGLVLFTASTMGAALLLPWPANVEAMVIAATALVVALGSACIVADVVISPHHPSLRLAPIEQYKSGLVVGGVAWLSILAATAILLSQLLTAVASAPHLAGTIRVGIGALIVISLLAAVLIASRQGSGSGKSRRERPRFPKAFIATFVIVATAILALAGGDRIAALLVDIAIVAALLGISKRIVSFFWRDATGRDEEPVTETDADMRPLIVLAVVRFAILLNGDRGPDPDHAGAASGTHHRLEPVGAIYSARRGHRGTRLCRLSRLDCHSLHHRSPIAAIGAARSS